MQVKAKGRTCASHWWETTATGKDVAAQLSPSNHMIRLINDTAVVMTTAVKGAVLWVSGSYEVLVEV